MTNQNRKIALLTFALLASTLACRAATSLIFPDTPAPPTQISVHVTFAPTLLPPTPTTTQFEAACPLLLTDIMKEATSLKNDTEDNNKEETYLVTYRLKGDTLNKVYLENVPEDLKDEQKDRATHEAIWDYFVAIIPPEQRSMVSEFSIFTDGKGNYLAAVAQTSTDPKRWVLQADILDSTNYYDLTYTLIHEQGHLLTLTAEQVPPDLAVYNDPENQDIYDSEASTCPQYFTSEGCSKSDSYINEFFNRFWTDFYDEWQAIDLEKDEDVYYDELDNFYKTYQDQFLTDYAPTNPAEDIAESWAFFVLSPKPEPNSIADEKILFFYEYPELVQLRQNILDRVCKSFPQ